MSHNLKVPVLCHGSLKPAYSCITSIQGYFSSLRRPIRDEELIIVGDRVFTDVVMANRMRGKRKHLPGVLDATPDGSGEKDISSRPEETPQSGTQPDGPLAIWTTDVWYREAMAMRWCEKRLVDAVQRWTSPRLVEVDTSRFLKAVIKSPKLGLMQGLFSRRESA